MENLQKAIKIAKEHKQEKVVKELEKNKNPELVEQILKINFEQIEDCKEKIGKEEQYIDEKIENVFYTDGNKLKKEEKEYYEKIGADVISKARYAVVTMAGGQRNKIRTFWAKRNFFN